MISSIEWFKITSLPRPGVSVLLYCESVNTKGQIRGTTLRAKWIPEFFQEDDGDFQGDCAYSEAKDNYFWPEGWYEWNEYEDTHWLISSEPRMWCSLPKP